MAGMSSAITFQYAVMWPLGAESAATIWPQRTTHPNANSYFQSVVTVLCAVPDVSQTRNNVAATEAAAREHAAKYLRNFSTPARPHALNLHQMMSMKMGLLFIV